PVPDRDHDACDNEGQKQRDEKIFPRAEGVLIVSVSDHEIPKIRERIRHIRHGSISGRSRENAGIRATATPPNARIAQWAPPNPTPQRDRQIAPPAGLVAAPPQSSMGGGMTVVFPASSTGTLPP